MTLLEMRLPRVLLVEPQFVLRRTLCAVAAELGLAEVTEALSIESAHAKLKSAAFDAVVLGSLQEQALAQWVKQIRSGQAACGKDMRIVALQAATSTVSRESLERIGVDLVLERPFKVGQVFSAVIERR